MVSSFKLYKDLFVRFIVHVFKPKNEQKLL